MGVKEGSKRGLYKTGKDTARWNPGINFKTTKERDDFKRKIKEKSEKLGISVSDYFKKC